MFQQSDESAGELAVVGRFAAARARHPVVRQDPNPHTMSPYLAELLGTMLLVVLGDGVVGNVVLNKTKGNNAGWIVITAGWAFAVTIAVYATGSISGAHLNPAVTIAMASIGKFAWASVPGYIASQVAGGLLGGVIVWLAYLPHWAATDDQAGKLAVFSTGPAIRNSGANVIAEIIGTFVLVLALLTVLSPANLVPGSDVAKGFGPMLVGLIVWSIGLSLGGTTGYAINPARDLGPRIAHAILPIAGKGGSDWSYAWVPVVGPVIGGLLGAVTYKALWGA